MIDCGYKEINQMPEFSNEVTENTIFLNVEHNNINFVSLNISIWKSLTKIRLVSNPIECASIYELQRYNITVEYDKCFNYTGTASVESPAVITSQPVPLNLSLLTSTTGHKTASKPRKDIKRKTVVTPSVGHGTTFRSRTSNFMPTPSTITPSTQASSTIIINTVNTNAKKTLTGTTPTTIPSTQLSSSKTIYTEINTNGKKTLTPLLQSSTVQTTKDKSLKTEIITGTLVAVFSCVLILIFLIILKRKNILCRRRQTVRRSRHDPLSLETMESLTEAVGEEIECEELRPTVEEVRPAVVPLEQLPDHVRRRSRSVTPD